MKRPIYLVCAILCLMSFVQLCKAQKWEPVTSLEGGASMNVIINSLTGLQQERGGLARVGNLVFSHGGRRMYVSTDQGKSWSYSGSGLPPGPYEFCHRGSVLFASICSNGEEGIYRSTNNGAQWQAVSETGLAGFSHIRSVYDIAANDKYVFAIMRDNVNGRGKIVICRSDDDGQSWFLLQFPQQSLTIVDDDVFPRPLLLAADSTLVCCMDGYTYKASLDNGNQFDDLASVGLPDATTRPVLSGRYLYVVSNSKSFVLQRLDLLNPSKDASTVNIGGGSYFVTGLSLSDNRLFARMFRKQVAADSSIQWWTCNSSDSVWTILKAGRSGNEDMLHMPLAMGGADYLVASDRAMLRSSDNAQNFELSQEGYRNFGSDLSFIASCGNALCLSDYEHIGFYSSTNEGASWETDFYALDRHPQRKLAELSLRAFATGPGLIRFDSSSISRSVDGSRNWIALDIDSLPTQNLQRFVPMDYHAPYSIFMCQYKLISSMSRRFYTLDDSLHFKELLINPPHTPIERGLMVRGNSIVSLDPANSFVYSSDKGASWNTIECEDPKYRVSYYWGGVAALSEAGGEFFIRCSLMRNDSSLPGYPVCHVRNGKLQVLEELVDNSANIGFSDILNFHSSVFEHNDTIFIITSRAMYESHDHGSHFQPYVNSGLPGNLPIVSIARRNNKSYALVDGGGLYVQTLSTSVEEQSPELLSDKCNISPIPCTSTLQLKAQSQIVKTDIFSNQGQHIAHTDPDPSHLVNVDLSGYSAGCYHLIVTLENGDVMHRSVVKVEP